MTLYYNQMCKCGHTRGIHMFPNYADDSKDMYNRPSGDPGCRFGHKKRLGPKKKGVWVVNMGSGSDVPCGCQLFKLAS